MIVWYATLQVNIDHTGKFTTFMSRNGDVMLTSMKSYRSPTNINTSLKFRRKENLYCSSREFIREFP